DASSIIDYKREILDFNFKTLSNFSDFGFNNPGQTTTNNNFLDRNSLKLFNKVILDYDNSIKLTLSNNSYTSSLLTKDHWFNPGFNLFWSITSSFYGLKYSEGLNYWTFSIGYGKNVNDIPLYYSNLAHNSLTILPEQSLSYTTNQDLFAHSNLQIERVKNFEIETQAKFFQNRLSLGINYHNSKNYNNVFPVVTNSIFELQNIADIENQGFEASLSFDSFEWSSDSFQHNIGFVFSRNETKVIALNSDNSIIPIAGFASVSNSLIEGLPAGMIVGTAYERNDQGELVIDSNGFPLVSNNLKILGDPTPDFKLGITNSFRYKNLSLNIDLDIQKGGDVWNGTQNVLNYHGVSQESANQRNIKNYVFNGVTTSGAINTTPVDFANPNQSVFENRWVQYGYGGVAEDAIEDASYLNIKSIRLTYKLFENNYRDSRIKFFNQIAITLFADNLFTFSKFNGANPYSSLFDTNSGNSLNYFNSPLQSRVGFKIHIKI
ncbi:MAG: hypothetical protein HRT68_13230, partial [Flavobacteriaceae bacterium]|nr:hypothetical protein [Flavobacteriaceae bacterium]